MKNIVILLLFAVSQLIPLNCCASDNSLEVEAKKLMEKKHLLGFQENMGQMKGTNNLPVPSVLFKVETPGLNIWVTTSGLTYQFFTIDEELTTRAKNEFVTERIGKEKKEKNIRWHRVDMVLQNASILRKNIYKIDRLNTGKINYYSGHCKNGIFNINTYGKIIIKEVYSGIDWVLYTSDNKKLKHEFIVSPQADPNQISLIYRGSGNIAIEKDALQFTTKLGKVTEGELFCYQNIANKKRIKSTYKTKKIPLSRPNLPWRKESLKPVDAVFSSIELFEQEVNFSIGSYNKNFNLVIDPELVWGTIYGGSGNEGFMDANTDEQGNLFITGYLGSADFPVNNNGTFFQGTYAASIDAFILKFNSAGVLEWGTYYGGNNEETGNAIATDLFGNVFVTGFTFSDDFPTEDAGTYYEGNHTGDKDVFILKFDNDGNRLWATYYGKWDTDEGNSITTDLSGNVWITGFTWSPGFETFSNGTGFIQAAMAGYTDAFILKFDNNGNRLWSTFYGGGMSQTGRSIASDRYGNIWITGVTISTDFPTLSAGAFEQLTNGGSSDVFILKFDTATNRLWSTYYGGSGDDVGHVIAIDSIGNAFITGTTNSTNFPTKDVGTFFQGTFGGGTSDVFFLKFDNNTDRLWSTYYGSNMAEAFSSTKNMVIDNCNNIYAAFETTSSNLFGVSKNACSYFDNTFNGQRDIFITQFNNDGDTIWASYIGGNATEARSSLAVDANNNLYLTGEFKSYTDNSTLPMQDQGNGAYFVDTLPGNDESFIFKFEPLTLSTSLTKADATCLNCDGSATVTVTNCGQTPYSYFWSNNIQTLNTNSSDNTISNLCPGNYNVIITSNCNTKPDTVYFTIGANAPVIGMIEDTICEGDSIFLEGAFQTIANTYYDTLFGGSSLGCDSVTATNLNVISDNAEFNYSSPNFCLTDTNPLPVISGLIGGTFTIDNGEIDSTSGEINLSISGLGNFSVFYTTNGMCPNTDTVLISIIDCTTPVAIFTVSDSTLCEGHCINFTNESINDTAWSWSFNGGTPSNSLSENPANVCFNEAGTHLIELIAFNNFGSDTTSKFIQVYSSPDIEAGNDRTIILGDSVILNATGPEGVYAWTPENWVSCTTCSATVVSPEETITYSVNVTDTNGCSSQDQITVEIFINLNVYIPNSFTPNNDGFNETFLPLGSEMAKNDYMFTIFNRWGELIFKSDDPQIGWNGSYKGNLVKQDTYIWKLSFEDVDGKMHEKIGKVIIVK